MNILDAAVLSVNGRDPERKRRLEFAIFEGLHDGDPGYFVAFKEALDVYIDLKEHHVPEFPEFVYSLRLPWVLREFTEEEHASARAKMTDEQGAAMDKYHALVERVLADA